MKILSSRKFVAVHQLRGMLDSQQAELGRQASRKLFAMLTRAWMRYRDSGSNGVVTLQKSGPQTHFWITGSRIKVRRRNAVDATKAKQVERRQIDNLGKL